MARNYDDDSRDRDDDWEDQRRRNERRLRSPWEGHGPNEYESRGRQGDWQGAQRGYYSEQVTGGRGYGENGWQQNRPWDEPRSPREQSRWLELREGYGQPTYTPRAYGTPYSYGEENRARRHGEEHRSGNTLRGGFSGKGPRGYVRSDERIREDVSDRLSWDDQVDASDITVTVSGGEVTLEGTVPDRMSKRRAEDIAEDVMGVKDVHNRLKANKGLIQEVGDKVMGRESEHSGHAGSGTRNQPAGNSISSAQNSR